MTNRKECLDTANSIVHADRQNDYGSPEDNFKTVATYWNNYLMSCKGVIKPEDVAVMLLLLKVARIATSPAKDDNWIDIAGYASCGCEIATCGK